MLYLTFLKIKLKRQITVEVILYIIFNSAYVTSRKLE